MIQIIMIICVGGGKGLVKRKEPIKVNLIIRTEVHCCERSTGNEMCGSSLRVVCKAVNNTIGSNWMQL